MATTKATTLAHRTIPTSAITSGTFADARIASSNVTQHEGSIDALASNPTIALGSNTTFPAGHVIQTKYFHYQGGSNQSFAVPNGANSSAAAAISLYGQTVQITGISATQGNRLIISANAGDLFTNFDQTHQSNLGFLIDGTYYNCSSSYGHHPTNEKHCIPVRPMLVFEVPANFTSKTIACAAYRETGGTGTYVIEARAATSGAGYHLSMTVTEIQT